MPSKILNRFGIDTGIQQIRDVGVPELMGSDIKIDAVYDLGIILLMTAQFGIDHALDLLTVDVLVVSSFFCGSNIYILPYSLELRICQRFTISVCNHKLGLGTCLYFTQTIHKAFGNRNVPTGGFGFQHRGDFRLAGFARQAL